MSENEEVDIASFDFRLFEGSDGYLSFGEVYYNSEGNPIAWTESGVSPGGETIEEVIDSLRLMLAATSKPVFHPPQE